MFSEKYIDKNKLKNSIKGKFSIVPPLEDRKYWEGIRAAAYEEIKRYINGIGTFDFSLPASLYLEFVRNGNRSRCESIFFKRRKALIAYALMEAMENKGNYIDKILDFVWMILEETTWCIPAHGYLSKYADGLPNDEHPALDLFQAETGCTLSFVLSLFKKAFQNISKNIVPRMKREIDFRVIDNFLIHDDYWWQGFENRKNENGKDYVLNNWNPWILSNVLLCAATVTDSNDKMCQVLEKVMKSLDNYADVYPQDGACDEGPGYWGHAGLSLLDCAYYLNKITNGYINEFKNEKLKNTAEYIAKVHIGNGYFVNFADCAPQITTYYGTIYKYGKLLGNKMLISFAKEASLLDKSNTFTLWQMPRALEKYEATLELDGTLIPETAVQDVYFESTQVMVCRQGQTSDGLFLAAKGGHNDESHNHNDVGSFIVYKDAEPFLIDPSNEAYCAKTFSEKRYEIWNNQSCFHNTPTINGMDQLPGKKFCAKSVSYHTESDKTFFSLDIKNAYWDNSTIKHWKRTFVFSKEKEEILLTEDFALDAPSDNICLNLMTVCKVDILSDKLVFTADSGNTLVMISDFSKFAVRCETVNTADDKILNEWGKAPTRIRLTLKEKMDKGVFTFRIK